MSSLDLPVGQEIEIEFVRESKPLQKGILPRAVDYNQAGFEFIEVAVPPALGFQEPFRLEVTRKWVNLSTVAEIRYLAEGRLRAEFERLRQLHDQVRGGVERR
ncbi:MAG: hypothetical protein HUU35_02255 [Armatimonadetes bacterium]|nr:hypothetical protein [Armatimonadota bacterium]